MTLVYCILFIIVTVVISIYPMVGQIRFNQEIRRKHVAVIILYYEHRFDHLTTHVHQEMLNFGLVPSDSGPRSLDLILLNSGSRVISLTSLVATPVTEALAVDFQPLKVMAETRYSTDRMEFLNSPKQDV